MSLVTNPQHGVTFGSVNGVGGMPLMSAGKPVVSSAGYTVYISRDGTTWGNPDVTVTTLISDMAAGDIVTEDHVGNRQAVLYVKLEADTHAGLVAGDTALSAVVGRPCELYYQPPDPAAPPSVIDALHTRMDWGWDDFDEVNRRRVWVLTISGLPWVRGASLVSTPAVATAALTVVNNGSATAGWTATRPPGVGAPTVVSGAIVSSYNAATADAFGNYGTRLTLTGTINTATEKFIAIDWKSSIPAYSFFLANGSPYLYPLVRSEPLAAGYTRNWYKIDAAVNSLSSISFDISHAAGSGTQTLSIDQVQKSATLPISGTGRQVNRFIKPGGNVTTEGSVIVEDASAGLGMALVYSCPATGAFPPLRPYVASSDAVTADGASRFSGFFNSLTGVTDIRLPISACPSGEVHLWASLGTSSGTGNVGIFWSADAWINGTVVGSDQSGTTICSFPTVGVWGVYPIARLVLPPAYVGIGGYVSIRLQRDASASQVVQFDEAWAFDMERGRLTVVDCGTGTPSSGTVHNRLRITAPSLQVPFGRIEVATAADFSDGRSPADAKVLCEQVGHKFDPTNGSNIFTATANSINPSVSLLHYERYRAEVG